MFCISIQYKMTRLNRIIDILLLFQYFETSTSYFAYPMGTTVLCITGRERRQNIRRGGNSVFKTESLSLEGIMFG